MNRHQKWLALAASMQLGLMAPAALAEETGESKGDETTELDTITINASAFGDRSADELAQPVDVLFGDALERRKSNSLGETLSNELGVTSSDFGPGVGRPVIRGQGGPRVRILENGISTMDASSTSADHAVSLDPAHAEQVEILKGPATLLYGSGASAGVINVVNGRLPNEVVPGVHGSAALGFTDNGSGRSARADVSIGFDEFVLRADASGRRRGDVEIPSFAESAARRAAEGQTGGQPSGELDNSSLIDENGSATAAWIRDERILSATVSGLRTNYGVPGQDHGGGNPEQVRIAISSTRVDLNGEWFDTSPGIQRLRARVGVVDYEHVELEGGSQGTVFENREVEARIEATHAALGGWRGIVGAQIGNRDLAAIGDEAFIPPVETRSAGLFWIEERELGSNRIELGARVENIRHDPRSGGARDDIPVSLSAAYLHKLNRQHHLRLTATRSQRAPNAEALFSFGPHLATTSFERGNAALDIETAHNVELGVDRHRGPWRWRINLFANRIQDYIYQTEVDRNRNADGSGNGSPDGVADRVEDDGQFDPDGELLLLDYAADDALFVGAEAETSLRMALGPITTTARLFADTVRGEIIDGPNLPRVTPTRVGASLDAVRGPWSGRVALTRAFEQDDVSPLETSTEGYTQLAADLEFALPGRRGALVLRGRNLLDEEIRRHTSFLKDVAPVPGRAFTVGARLEFGI